MDNFVALFAGRNGLDFEASRLAVTRIPEVSQRVKEAQKVLDQLSIQNFDLYNFINSDTDVFMSNIKLKSFASAIVQVGLFDRLIKNRMQPNFMIGSSNGDSAMSVCAGKKTIKELVLESQALQILLPPSEEEAGLKSDATEILPLAGISLTDFLIYRFKDNAYEALSERAMHSWDLLKHIVARESIDRVVSLGPNLISEMQLAKYRESFDFNLVDSIEIDPMLSWFWREVKASA